MCSVWSTCNSNASLSASQVLPHQPDPRQSRTWPWMCKAQTSSWRTGTAQAAASWVCSSLRLRCEDVVISPEHSCSPKACRLSSLLWSRFLRRASNNKPFHCIAMWLLWICKDSELGCWWTRLPAPALIIREFGPSMHSFRASLRMLFPSRWNEMNPKERIRPGDSIVKAAVQFQPTDVVRSTQNVYDARGQWQKRPNGLQGRHDESESWSVASQCHSCRNLQSSGCRRFLRSSLPHWADITRTPASRGTALLPWGVQLNRCYRLPLPASTAASCAAVLSSTCSFRPWIAMSPSNLNLMQAALWGWRGSSDRVLSAWSASSLAAQICLVSSAVSRQPGFAEDIFA